MHGGREQRHLIQLGARATPSRTTCVRKRTPAASATARKSYLHDAAANMHTFSLHSSNTSHVFSGQTRLCISVQWVASVSSSPTGLRDRTFTISGRAARQRCPRSSGESRKACGRFRPQLAEAYGCCSMGHPTEPHDHLRAGLLLPLKHVLCMFARVGVAVASL